MAPCTGCARRREKIKRFYEKKRARLAEALKNATTPKKD